MSFPTVRAPAAIGSGTCARPTPSTTAPSRVGKSLAIRGPDTAISIARPLSLSDKAHFEEFSEPCKVALLKIAATREACRTDIGDKCPGLKLGAGRLFLRVKKHFSALSEPCKDAIGHAAAKRQHIEPE